jgi:hypothetical protein
MDPSRHAHPQQRKRCGANAASALAGTALHDHRCDHHCPCSRLFATVRPRSVCRLRAQMNLREPPRTRGRRLGSRAQIPILSARQRRVAAHGLVRRDASAPRRFSGRRGHRQATLPCRGRRRAVANGVHVACRGCDDSVRRRRFQRGPGRGQDRRVSRSALTPRDDVRRLPRPSAAAGGSSRSTRRASRPRSSTRWR